MKHSSRKTWSALNKLTGRKKSSTSPISLSANSIASCLLCNGKYTNPNKLFTYSVNQKLKEAWNAPSVDQDLTSEFTIEELVAAKNTLKPGKSAGPDNIHPEFILHVDDLCLKWLTNLFSTCMKHKKMPKSWKMAKIIAVLKPNKPTDSPKSYWSISLLSVTYKLLERLICNRILPIVESILPEEQAGYRPNRRTLDQVALLTKNIEFAFSKNMEAGTVLVDLSAAYDTVWHRGLTLKLLQIIPSKDMERMIMSMITQR